MEILLTHGYFIRDDPAEMRVNKPYPPLGLLYLSSYLKREGIEVDLFDSTFATLEQLRTHIRTTRPARVGIYVNMLTRRSVLEIIDYCRGLDIPVILGGPEPVNYPGKYLDRGAAIIVAGEGEETIVELLRGNDPQEVPGVIFRRDGCQEFVRTAERERIRDLDSLPFPDREAIDLELYLDHWQQHHGVRSVSLITSRGCPYTCRWCSHSVYGFSYRTRSPESVADEVEQLVERYQPDHLWYADDVFTINKKWLRRYADELERRHLSIPFETITREDRLDEETIESLARMQCRKLWVGAESGSQRVLDRMDRRTNAERMRTMIRALRAQGIETGTFIMLGYDGETMDDLVATGRHLASAQPDEVLTTVSYPIKGTPFYDEVQERIIANSEWEESCDRDLSFAGQQSPRFYGYAARWLQAGVAFARASRRGNGFSLHVLALWIRKVLYRTAMNLAWREARHG